MRLSKSLMSRLVSYFLLLALVTVSLIAYMAYLRARDTLTESLFDQLRVAVTLKEDELNRWVGIQKNDVISLSQLPTIQQQVSILLNEDEATPEFQAAYALLYETLDSIVTIKSDFQELFILSDVGGKIILSTNRGHVGEYRVTDSYFTQGRLSPYVQNVYPSPATGKPTITISAPVFDENSQTLGVLAAHINLASIDQIMLERTGLGSTGETYLVDKFNVFVSEARLQEGEFLRGVHTEGIDQALEGISGQGLYLNYKDVPVVGVYTWVEEQELALLAEMQQTTAFIPAQELAVNIFISGVLAAVFLALSVYVIARQIAAPILSITETATRIADGDFSLIIPVTTQDEIGVLAMAFNSITRQMRGLVAGLETRVTDRTRELEQHTNYLEASTQVSRIVTSTLNQDELTSSVVGLIRERFEMYYVGLFLTDRTKTWAILNAGSGKEGHELPLGSRLEVKENSMIGWAIINQQARIAKTITDDVVRLASPELPLTKSEIAIPVYSRGNVLGALSVQSDRANAFDADFILVLQTMADQIATALDNTYLFADVQEALQTSRRAYSEASEQDWQALLEKRNLTYRGDSFGVIPLTENGEPDDETAETLPEMLIPIKVREQVIGTINAHKSSDAGRWTPDETDTLQALSEQLAIALDSARLHERTRKQAEQERLVGEITARMRSSLDIETLLRTAAREIREALDLFEVEVRLGTGTPTQDKSASN